MTNALLEEIDQLRHDMAFLARTVRSQQATIDTLAGRIDDCASSCEASLAHLVFALQSIRQIGRVAHPERRLPSVDSHH